MWNSVSRAHLPEELEFEHRWKTAPGTPVGTRRLTWETCEIEDMEGLRPGEGYIRSHWFQAHVEEGPKGSYVVAESSAFYCPGYVPELEHAEVQHAALVARLKAAGWEPASEGGRGWWNLSFRRVV